MSAAPGGTGPKHAMCDNCDQPIEFSAGLWRHISHNNFGMLSCLPSETGHISAPGMRWAEPR